MLVHLFYKNATSYTLLAMYYIHWKWSKAWISYWIFWGSLFMLVSILYIILDIASYWGYGRYFFPVDTRQQTVFKYASRNVGEKVSGWLTLSDLRDGDAYWRTCCTLIQDKGREKKRERSRCVLVEHLNNFLWLADFPLPVAPYNRQIWVTLALTVNRASVLHFVYQVWR